MRHKKMNKKGAEMTIGTIIIIILALVLLVVLIYGFSSGWGNLWDKITSYGGGKVNVQSVVDGCKISCTTNAMFDYCIKKTKVTFTTDAKDTRNNLEYTCKSLEYQNIGVSCDSLDCSSQTKALMNNCAAWTGKVVARSSCDTKTSVGLDMSDASSQDLTCCVVKKYCEKGTESVSGWNGQWVNQQDPCPAEMIPQKDSSSTMKTTILSTIIDSDKTSGSHPGQTCCIPK